MKPTPTCRNRWCPAPRQVNGRCRPCDAYLRKYGKARPFAVIALAAERVIGRRELEREPAWPARSVGG